MQLPRRGHFFRAKSRKMRRSFNPDLIIIASKTEYSLEPIYLHTSERIEALLLLFKIALQMVDLIERNTRRNIAAKEKGLDNLMPNNKDVRNPSTKYFIFEFQYIVRGEMVLPDDNRYSFISKLNLIQEDFLSISEVPIECHSSESLAEYSTRATWQSGTVVYSDGYCKISIFTERNTSNKTTLSIFILWNIFRCFGLWGGSGSLLDICIRTV